MASTHTENDEPSAILGLFRLRRKWTLTWKGWAVLIGAAVLGLWTAVLCLDPFLSTHRPLRGDALVIEGWLPDYAVEEAVRQFNNNGYRFLITTGGPLEKGNYLQEHKNYADLTAATCKALGVSRDRLRSVPASNVLKNRTYVSAVSLGQWMSTNKVGIQSLDVATYGPHARRSWRLFKLALGDRVSVGVIHIPREDYDQQYWWRTSEGFRETTGEALAWFYYRFFFHPR